MAYQDFTSGTIAAESGGNPYAQNPRSTAGGSGQFIDATWLDMIAKYKPELAARKTRQQILQLKFDPALSREMTAAYSRENQDYLKSRGIPVDATSNYLAHFAGPSGAAALYANPEASVEATLGPRVVSANPFLRGMTGQDAIAWASRKGNKGSSAASMTAENLRKKFGTKTEGGTAAPAQSAVAASSGQAALAGGDGMDTLKSALSGKSYDQSRIDGYGNLAKVGQDVASKATGWQQALLGIGTAGVGSYLKGSETEKKKEFDAALAGAVAGASNPTEVARLLIQSPDEKMKAAGIELLTKSVGQAPQSRTIDGPYGQKIQQDYVGGQWVTAGGAQTGTPNFSGPPPSSPVAAPQAVEAIQPQPIQPQSLPPVQAAPMAPQPQQPAPAIGGNMGNLASMPSEGGVNAAAKQDMLQPQAPATQPQQQQPVAQPQAPQIDAQQFATGPAVPKAPDGFVHKLAPDGSGYLYSQSNGQPVFEPKSAADERGKAAAGVEAQAQTDDRVAQQFAGGLSQLQRLPEDFGKIATERALGPYAGSEPATAEEKSGFWGTGISVDSISRNLARGYGELQTAMQGGAAPTEVRDRVDTATKNLAAVMKPLIRKPGEGAWSDKDQANLEAQLGSLTRSRSLEEYNRRLEDIKQNVSQIFKIKVPEVEKQPRRADAPRTAEDEQTKFYSDWFAKEAAKTKPASGDGWAEYRKQYLGY